MTEFEKHMAYTKLLGIPLTCPCCGKDLTEWKEEADESEEQTET